MIDSFQQDHVSDVTVFVWKHKHKRVCWREGFSTHKILNVSLFLTHNITWLVTLTCVFVILELDLHPQLFTHESGQTGSAEGVCLCCRSGPRTWTERSVGERPRGNPLMESLWRESVRPQSRSRRPAAGNQSYTRRVCQCWAGVCADLCLKCLSDDRSFSHHHDWSFKHQIRRLSSTNSSLTFDLWFPVPKPLLEYTHVLTHSLK